MNLDWLIPLPFFIAALLAHLGVNFSEKNYDTGEKK
jgi:hypothetical protein